MIDKIKNYVKRNSFIEYEETRGNTIFFVADQGINPEPYKPAESDVNEVRRIGKELIKKFDVKAKMECLEEHVMLYVKVK